jgi:nitrate reductase NapE component
MSDAASNPLDNPRFSLGWRDTLRVLWPYVRRNFMNQVSGIWFIVTYLIVFQLLVLQLPISFALMIGVGILVVAAGLMFFMEGLRLGLMPLGEQIGSVLPKHSRMPVILVFAFLLGLGATFAEPAIAVLKSAGAGIRPDAAPLLYSLLNDFSGQLVACVGIGVGFAVVLGVLRFFFAWPLKTLAIPVVTGLLGLSFFYTTIPHLNDVLGLAWDCGAVTTGPVTVPLVLALGIGVCRVVSANDTDAGNSGFGIVTLASLFPILAVLLLAGYHYMAQDYYGTPGYQGKVVELQAQEEAAPAYAKNLVPIGQAELDAYLRSGELPAGHQFSFEGGSAQLVDGRILVVAPTVVIEKQYLRPFSMVGEESWDDSIPMAQRWKSAVVDALRAIIPLCIFLYLVLRMVLKQRLDPRNDVGVGITFAFIGMALFGLGIAIGLTPLGAQLGSNVPIAFAEIVPWGLDHIEGPLFSDHGGKLMAIGFAFFLGYGATLAEPALNALGETVERLTVGAFRKKLLMQSVALGVGMGIAAGIMKLAYNLPLFWLLLPPYLLVVLLTIKAPHDFVNFSWDSAGVTTGPITVPLVLAMGLGVGANVPGVSDGFGILALASVGPILTVLTVGLYTQRQRRQEGEQSTTAVSPIEELAV